MTGRRNRACSRPTAPTRRSARTCCPATVSGRRPLPSRPRGRLALSNRAGVLGAPESVDPPLSAARRTGTSGPIGAPAAAGIGDTCAAAPAAIRRAGASAAVGASGAAGGIHGVEPGDAVDVAAGALPAGSASPPAHGGRVGGLADSVGLGTAEALGAAEGVVAGALCGGGREDGRDVADTDDADADTPPVATCLGSLDAADTAGERSTDATGRGAPGGAVTPGAETTAAAAGRVAATGPAAGRVPATGPAAARVAVGEVLTPVQARRTCAAAEFADRPATHRRVTAVAGPGTPRCALRGATRNQVPSAGPAGGWTSGRAAAPRRPPRRAGPVALRARGPDVEPRDALSHRASDPLQSLPGSCARRSPTRPSCCSSHPARETPRSACPKPLGPVPAVADSARAPPSRSRTVPGGSRRVSTTVAARPAPPPWSVGSPQGRPVVGAPAVAGRRRQRIGPRRPRRCRARPVGDDHRAAPAGPSAAMPGDRPRSGPVLRVRSPVSPPGRSCGTRDGRSRVLRSAGSPSRRRSPAPSTGPGTPRPTTRSGVVGRPN